MSVPTQPSITAQHERVRKRIPWCRARIAGEYNEQRVNSVLTDIEASLDDIMRSNTPRARSETLKRLQHLNEQLVTLDHDVIDPTIRRFSPLLKAWTPECDALLNEVRRRPPETVPSEVMHAIAELERQRQAAAPQSTARATVPPEDVPSMVAHLHHLIEVVRAFVHRS